MTTSQFILAFDLGTSSLKGGLFGRDGTCISTSTQPLALSLPEPGWAEQNCDDWWDAIVSTAHRLIEEQKIEGPQIAAIGVSAQMCGTIAIDKAGHPLLPAMIWLDTRSHQVAKDIMDGWITISGYGVTPLLSSLWTTNGAPNLSGKDPTSKILWIKKHRPDIWQQTERLFDVKDYISFRLTGVTSTTPDCAHLSWLMDSRTNQWSHSILKRNGIPIKFMPDIVPPTTCLGNGLLPEAAFQLGIAAGTPVVAGLGDVTATSLASGAVQNGAPNIYAGTSAWCAAHYPNRKVDPWTAIGTIRAADPEKYILVAAQETAGAGLERVADLLGLQENGKPDVAGLMKLAEQSEPGARDLHFLPWLLGERCPVDDPHLRGGFLNLDLAHNRGDITRAAIEGVCLNIRWASLHLFRNAKTPSAHPVRLLGGLAESDFFAQVLSDVLNLQIERIEAPKMAGVLGAAMCAATGIDWFASIQDSLIWTKKIQMFKPNSSNTDLYAKKYDAFKRAWRNNKNWFGSNRSK